MEKYVVDCKIYTRECFNKVLDLLEIVTGVEFVEVDLVEQIVIIKVQELRIANTLQNIFSMSDIAEMYK